MVLCAGFSYPSCYFQISWTSAFHWQGIVWFWINCISRHLFNFLKWLLQMHRVFESLAFNSTAAARCAQLYLRINVTILMALNSEVLSTWVSKPSFQLPPRVKAQSRHHHPAERQGKEESPSLPCQLHTSLVPNRYRQQTGSAQSRSGAHGEWVGIFSCFLLGHSLLPAHMQALQLCWCVQTYKLDWAQLSLEQERKQREPMTQSTSLQLGSSRAAKCAFPY